MDRKPVRATYDAVVGLFPPRTMPTTAFALVKSTFRIQGHRLERDEPVPLFQDFWNPAVEPRLLPGTDFWPFKLRTDVVVLGKACAPDARPTASMEVSVAVGRRIRRIRVSGRRIIEWASDGRPRIGSPEPFTEMPVTWDRAYGGADERVPVDPPASLAELVRLQSDHPGLYPRNPFGRGYLVVEDPAEGVEMPNLEDPDDLLTSDRLIVGDPARWYRQPLPVGLEWVNPLMFPRFALLGIDAWHPPPDDDSLPEVRRGYLPTGYRSVYGAEAVIGRPPPPEYFQEAPPGMSFASLAPETPIVVEGMHPEEERLTFALPAPPSIEILIETTGQRLQPMLTNLVILPDLKRVTLTWAVHTTELPRVFIPGVHGKIPLAVRVEGDVPVMYETPPTVRSQLREAMARKP